jgi:hypothetical protein
MVALLLFCDESGKYRKNPVVSISGIGGTRNRLDSFNHDWVVLLRSYGIAPELHMSRIADLSQSCGSKMPGGQTIDERIDVLLPFADCINDHLEIGLMQTWDVKGFNNLPIEVKRRLGGSNDPYQLSFIRGLLEIADYVGEDGTVSVLCDDDEVTAWDTYIHWRAIVKAMPELSKKFIAITFARSEHWAPLQAADMIAFLARREASEKYWNKPNEFKRLLDYVTKGPKASSRGTMRWSSMFASDQDLVNLANDVTAGDQERLSEVRGSDEASFDSTSPGDQGGIRAGKSSEEAEKI